MAIGTPSQSPAIVIKEVDLSGTVPNVQSTTGAIVGGFRWGPVETRQRISNETELAATFGTPNDAFSSDFHTAAYYLRYSSDLFVTRSITSTAKNAHDNVNAASDNPTIKNADDWDTQIANRDSDGHTFIARYPSDLGNALEIQVCPAHTASFTGWAYKPNFDGEPGTSTHAADKNALNDEVHVTVIDKLGNFGSKGAVLETYPFVSLALGAKNADGSTNYIKDIVNAGSNYIWMAGFESVFTDVGAGTLADSGEDFILSAPAIKTYSLSGGLASSGFTAGDVTSSYDLYEDVDTVTVDFLIAPGMTSRADQTTVVNDLVSTAKLRKDCVVVAGPAKSDIIGVNNSTTITTNVTATADTFTYDSTLFVDCNWLKVYDKYNDKYVNIPAASSTAGIMSASDANGAPWISPAGGRRGQYLGVTSTVYNPTKTQRDTLYKAGINPVGNIPGQGVLLFGDKTHMSRPSAFDRINVRRLFLVLERAIGEAAKNVMFELNDEFTRAEFVNIVEPVLREVKGRRGLTDFKVVCDETNNTSSVIDRNEFIANIFIKPARSINFITLNFVAVRSGVEFEEVVGTV